MSNVLREKLKSEVMATDFATLAPHFARGALIMVDSSLDLLDVAESVACDERAQVEAWLLSRGLWRATDDDAKRGLTLRFQFVIVQPWVLAQVMP